MNDQVVKNAPHPKEAIITDKLPCYFHLHFSTVLMSRGEAETAGTEEDTAG